MTSSLPVCRFDGRAVVETTVAALTWIVRPTGPRSGSPRASAGPPLPSGVQDRPRFGAWSGRLGLTLAAGPEPRVAVAHAVDCLHRVGPKASGVDPRSPAARGIMASRAQQIERAFPPARERYAELGVDVDRALDRLAG